MPYSLILSVLITAAIYWFLRKKAEYSCGKVGSGLAGVMILGMVLVQGNLFYKGLTVPGRGLKEVSIELGQILDKNAVLTGPYAPAYTIDNNLRGVIYHFGLSNKEDSLFKKFPISHVVTERPNWERALQDFPILGNARQEAVMITRDFVTSLFRLQVTRVPLSDFERALMLLEGGQADPAVLMLESILRRYPDNILVQKALADACNMAGFTTKYLNLIDSIAEKYPDNYRAIVFCGRSYLFLYEKTGDEQYRDKAEFFFEKVYQIMPELKM
jgi:tetratricopeptide (TPR) repeat protein